MAAPTPTARVTPNGRRLSKTRPSFITFSSNPGLDVWEKSVKPPGLDGGDARSTRNMHSTTYETFAAGDLIKLTEATVTVEYDPAVIVDIAALINHEQVITHSYPNGDTYCYYGYLQKWEPGDLDSGSTDAPTATMTIMPTNMDPSTCIPANPVFTPGPGTSQTC